MENSVAMNRAWNFACRKLFVITPIAQNQERLCPDNEKRLHTSSSSLFFSFLLFLSPLLLLRGKGSRRSESRVDENATEDFAGDNHELFRQDELTACD